MWRNVKAVIFDMDGVLVDSEPLWTESLVKFLARRKIKINPKNKEYKEYKRRLMGCRQVESITFFKKLYQLKGIYQLKGRVGDLIKERKRILFKIFRKKLKLRAGALRVIKKLNQEKIPLGLASSSSRDIIEFVLNKFNLKKYFQVCLSTEEIINGKPAPDIFLKVAQKLGAEPSQCLVFEDSPRGVRAAKRAGMKCIAILHQFNRRKDLKEADKIIACWSKLKW